MGFSPLHMHPFHPVGGGRAHSGAECGQKCGFIGHSYHTSNLLSCKDEQMFYSDCRGFLEVCQGGCKKQPIVMCPILTAGEGYVLGLGAKLFIIAGPVLVYGTVASVVYGLVLWIAGLF